MYQDVRQVIADARGQDLAELAHETCQTLEKDHDRLERRRSWLLTDRDGLAWLDEDGAGRICTG